MTRFDPPLRLPSRPRDAHKGQFGRLLMIGGSRGMAGSISLSSIAALRTGAGLVSAVVPDRCLETVAAFHPCVMTIPLPDDAAGRFAAGASDNLAERLGSTDVVGCGPGMTTGPGSAEIVRLLMEQDRTPRVLDADAINLLAQADWPNRPRAQDKPAVATGGPLVLTPHPGELARLVDVSPKDRDGQLDAAQQIAGDTGAVLVVKGGPTVVVSSSERWTAPTGNPGMATAGSGDVLTGVVAAMLGRGLDPWDAARLAVWIHGRAGDRAAERLGETGLVASDLLEEIPAAAAEASEAATREAPRGW